MAVRGQLGEFSLLRGSLGLNSGHLHILLSIESFHRLVFETGLLPGLDSPISYVVLSLFPQGWDFKCNLTGLDALVFFYFLTKQNYVFCSLTQGLGSEEQTLYLLNNLLSQ